WKFPYMAGDNGGSAFVIVYLAAILLIGLPVMVAEILLGRMGRENPINTISKLAKANNKSPYWQLTGWWGAFGLVLTLSFYSVVAGWAVGYFFKYAHILLPFTSATTVSSTSEILNQWQLFLGSALNLTLWHSIFIILTIGVVIAGVTSGIERASNIMMPMLFVILIILAVYASYYGEFMQGFSFLFKPNFSKLTSTVVIDALGHAFFTLAVGAGCMLTYGAYLPEHTSIVKSVFIIAGLDILVAFLSGMAIFPIVFANNLAPDGGPDLMFKVLPIAFATIPMGNFIGCMFFLLLIFAAWTSSISMAEPLVMILIERAKLSRIVSCFIVGIVCWIIGIFGLLSFNEWKTILLFNKWTFIDATMDLTTNIILPIGCLLFAIFAGWKLNPNSARNILSRQHDHHFKIWQFLIKYIAPIGIILILLNSLVG
ncbi:MAG: sodium-dependent transporter, partial [Gammaproteobacteria bacterium]|nr:sodium-dependent transporter [Gammaproteobacteria bacterium]